jgi:hypothetical protein
MSASYGTIEVVRGRLSEERADQLVRFWAAAGALDEATARARLPEVVCLLTDDDGQITGVNSVYPAAVDLIGGRELWVYRNYLRSGAETGRRAMAHRAFVALQAEFDPTVAGPIGLCFLIDDAAQIEQDPGAVWLYPLSRYAGYLEDGRQVRIRYFENSRVGGPAEMVSFPVTLDRSYRTTPFAEQDMVGAGAVIELWAREGAMAEDEARRRIDEVLVIATRGDSELVGVATTYLEHNAQLDMDMWYFRAFVAAEHRASGVGISLALVARDDLEKRFVSGQDTRAGGIVYEVENPGLKQYMDFGNWGAVDFMFIGENERGDHVRVHYFPGAIAPGPPE